MIRGWCPSLHEPMATGDGMLVRVKPRGGVLTSSEARLIAEQAALFGNGVLELTGRGNIQIRGLSSEGVAPFGRVMVAAGLAHADHGAERRRNVIGPPLASPATAAMVAALESAIEADETLASLPAKFGFVVDGGGALSCAGVKADVRLNLFDDHVDIVGTSVAQVPLNAAVSAALAQARTFSLSLRERVGVRVFPPGLPSPWPSPGGRGFFSPVGDVGGIAFGAGLPFGVTTARVWSALAELAERHGGGKLHLTPWRAVLIAGEAGDLRKPLADLGLIIDPDDPRLRVSACPGQPACASASAVTRTLASRLRPAVGHTIHVSGCAKGCAHPAAASITLVGRDGRFDLVRDGRAGDPPTQHGLTDAEVLAL